MNKQRRKKERKKERKKRINKQREGGTLHAIVMPEEKKERKKKKIRVIISMYVLNTWHEIVRGCSSEGRTTALN